MTARLCTVALTVLLLASSCRDAGRGDGAVPRRYAYPRVEMPDSAARTYGIGSLAAHISASAKVSRDNDRWLTADYPSLGATLYLSAMQTTALPEAVANRRQRISLNLGGAVARTERYTSAEGFDIEKVVCADGVATPVQFIATRDDVLVSGSFVISGAVLPADSIRPVVDILEKEADAIVNSLR